jgi:hypothetical protein
VPVLHSPWRFVVLVSSEMFCGVISWFCLTPCLSGTSFAFSRSCLYFCDFCLVPCLLGISFHLECFRLCFHDFG